MIVSQISWRCQFMCRVSDAGQRQRHDIHQWPASESRQGKNPRGMGRGECRALRYGDYMSGGTVKPVLPLLLRFLLFDRAAGFLPPRP